jgi:hypothetical protein
MKSRKKPRVAVERADLDAPRWRQHRDSQRIRAAFEAREAARGRPSVRNVSDKNQPEQPPRAAIDRAVKDMIAKGFSQEMAEAMTYDRRLAPARSWWESAGSGWHEF